MLPRRPAEVSNFIQTPPWVPSGYFAQVDAFARKAMGRIAFSRNPYRQIMSWVLPRAGKP